METKISQQEFLYFLRELLESLKGDETTVVLSSNHISKVTTKKILKKELTEKKPNWKVLRGGARSFVRDVAWRQSVYL